ncbi:GGDEF domain-containing protein [Nakamurella lactea]|uniref:GGDEF domain-containing protein n=1 Tax=Nakamurella lactea TaxID=459515 RepID=UPI0004203337|nr:GGDEF domain-containing protein [Nakamurella lactea]
MSVDLEDALTRAQRGEHEAVRQELRAEVARTSAAAQRLPILITLGAVEYYAGEFRGSVQTCGLAAELARELRAPGWLGYGLSVRAGSWIELGEVGGATDDLLQAELVLHRIGDSDPFAGRIRRSLAGSYAELELFEQALLHMSGVGTDEANRIADTINRSNLHLRWARWLHRVDPSDRPGPQQREHLLAAAAGLQTAAELIERGPRTWGALVDKMRKETAAQLDPAAGVEPLRALIDDGVDTGLANTTAVSLATLVTALRSLGRLDESEKAGRRALELIEDPRIYAETVTDVLFAVHRTQRALGVAGAAAADGYLAATSGELLRLRQERADAFAAQLEHELRRQALRDLRERAHRDPLTGLGNRRALAAWFAEHPRGPAAIALLDLDNFKLINDSYGHVVGDAVLVRLADALTATLEPGATVIRYGGDEFVVVHATGLDPSDRWTEQIRSVATTLNIDDIAPGQRLSASIGVRTASPEQDTRLLLDQADALMYRNKEPRGAR